MARTVRRPSAKAKPKADAPTTTPEAPEAVVTPTVATIKRVAEIPSKSFLDGYVHRVIDGLTDFEILDMALAQKKNVILEGPTGAGKTHCVYAWCAARGLHLYAFPSSAAVEPSQYRGGLRPRPDGSIRWQDGPMTDIVRHSGVIYINEGNFLRAAVASDMFGLLDKRRKIELLDNEGEVIYAADPFIVIMDFNVGNGYTGTQELNAAFRNRFPVQVPWDYDDKIEAKLVRCRSLREMAKQFRRDIASGLFETPVSTNMLIEFEEIALASNFQFAVRTFVTHFPVDDRGSVKQIVDTHSAGIEADLAALVKPASKGKDKAKDDDWDTSDAVWDYTDTGAENFQLFSPDDLAGLTVADKRQLAKDVGVPATVTRGMKVDELTQLLLGNHPYWATDDDAAPEDQ